MGRMANVLDHMKVDGTGLQEFTKQLGKLGIVTDDIDIEKMLNMAPDELMTEILRKAQEASAKAKKDIAEAKKALELNPKNITEAQDVQRQVLTIVRDNLGDEGQGLFIELERQGKTIDELHSLAKQTIFTDRTTNADANNFMEQVRVTKTLSENITKLLGSDIAKGLTPALTELNTWLLGHGDDIKNAMSSLAGAIEKIIGKTVDFAKDTGVQEKAKNAANEVKESVTGTLEGTKTIVEGVKDGDLGKVTEGAKQAFTATVKPVVTVAQNAGGEVEKKSMGMTDEQYSDFETARRILHDYWDQNSGHKVPIYTPLNRIKYDSLPEDKKKLVDENGGIENFPMIKDGIVRPDGTVTQVAPDDWVLAARNLGDLAKAFVPEEKQKSITEPVQNTAPAYRPMPLAKEEPKQSPIVIQQDKTEEKRDQVTEPKESPIVSIKEFAPASKQEAGPELIQKQIVAPAESEAPRIVPKDETPINNFVSQQPQPQVATDNWSIVAKTINDLARSFIQPQPQAVQQSAGEYTINQTFNISGGNDMPQIIRQQAYRGTQDGLLEVMQQSSQRLQLMSGTR